MASTPARMAAATARSITIGTLNPLQKEIDAIVNPMALTWEQAVRFKSILTVLFSTPDTYHLLYDVVAIRPPFKMYPKFGSKILQA